MVLPAGSFRFSRRQTPALQPLLLVCHKTANRKPSLASRAAGMPSSPMQLLVQMMQHSMHLGLSPWHCRALFIPLLGGKLDVSFPGLLQHTAPDWVACAIRPLGYRGQCIQQDSWVLMVVADVHQPGLRAPSLQSAPACQTPQLDGNTAPPGSLVLQIDCHQGHSSHRAPVPTS